MPISVRLALQLERIIYRAPELCAVDQSELPDFPVEELDRQHQSFDVLIDCSGGEAAIPQVDRLLRLTFNGVPSEVGAVSALFDGGDTVLAVVDGKSGVTIAETFPALSDRRIIGRSLNETCSMAVELLCATVDRSAIPAYRLPNLPAPAAPMADIMQGLRFVAGGVGYKAAKWLTIQLANHEQWTVCWRNAGTQSLLQKGSAQFARLSDDSKRYYADPFAISWKGDTHVFVEEYQFATQRGRIAAVKFGPDGPISSPRPVLEEAHHLSYPQVFASDGEVWMVPETGANSTVKLYRAVEFPFRWQCEAVLIEGVAAYDPTLFFDAGTWWMLASLGRHRGTGWDTLSAFRADRLEGPWRPAAGCPAVLDARLARSAGAILTCGDRPVRPAQDCTKFYGSGVSMCRIDRLDADAFQQTQVGEINSSGLGVHTYNIAGGIEVIDVFGRLGRRAGITANYQAVNGFGKLADSGQELDCET